MSPLKFLRNVLAALTGQTDPHELAGAVALGVLIGLIPKGNLLAQGLILLAFLLGINTALAFATAAAVLLATPLTDRLADPIGYALLVQATALKPLWTALYNQPLAPWTAFNNTVVLGSFVLGLALLAPVYLLARRGIARYQAQLKDTVMKWKIVQALKGSYWFQWLYGSPLP